MRQDQTFAFLVHGRPITWSRPSWKRGQRGGYVPNRKTKTGRKVSASVEHLERLTKAAKDAAMEQRIRQFQGPIGVRLHFHFAGRLRSNGFTGIEVFNVGPRGLFGRETSKLYGGTWAQAMESASAFAGDVFGPNADLVDMDNLEKLVLESLQHSGVIANDSQVAYVEKRKSGTLGGVER